MSHAPKCKCELCGVTINRRTWLASAKVIRAIHSVVARGDDNPAYKAVGLLDEAWRALPSEEKTEQKMKELVSDTLRVCQEDDNLMWPMRVLGCTKFHAQASDIRSQSPFDCGSRPARNPMFYATTYLGYHRVTVSAE